MPATPSRPTAATLAVVVCAYTLDRWADLVQCLRSVAAQSVPVDQLILVCDHNPQLSGRARRELAKELPQLLVLDSEGPRGLSGARNTGVAAAKADVVAFLDDDAVAEPTWAQWLLAGYEDGTVVGVSGRVVPSWRSGRPGWLPEEFLWVVGCSYRGQPEQRADVRNGIGASMSFRREVLAAIDGFDPSVGRIGKDAGGCEETELSIRARRARAGGRIVLEPRSVARHAVTADRVRLRYFLRRCAAEGRSKAVVSELVGSAAALATERDYTRQVLPAGVLRGVRDLLRGDPGGLGRAVMICVGLLVTASGYASTRASLRAPGRRP